MELTGTVKDLLKDTASKLKGTVRRQFMARVVRVLGRGGQLRVQKELGWSRNTAKKGEGELRSGIECKDAFNMRGAKLIEVRLPNLQADIRQIVEPQCQTDPSFRTMRLYRRVTAAEVRRQLIEQKGYREEELPSEETIRTRLNAMGYKPKRVMKAKPKKKIRETDAIFDQLKHVHEEAKTDVSILRVSVDTKATVKVGEFSRGGKSRVCVNAVDHDFEPDATLTPVGIFLPAHDDLYLGIATSKVTSDCIVDQLDAWWTENKIRFPSVRTLLLNQDNGPENNSRRTQFIKRIVEFADKNQIDVRLAYYPPYHSKYNPVERCFGALENYWRGELLDSTKGVVEFASGMRWKGRHPVVKLVDDVYQTGMRLGASAMRILERRLHRLPGLEKWFVDIVCQAPVPTSS